MAVSNYEGFHDTLCRDIMCNNNNSNNVCL